jgi:anti-repressor protein
MEELLKVSYDKDRITLSARELHEFLEIKTKYKDWFPRMCEYGFEENVDYQAMAQKRATAQGNETTFTDHQITIDMAKEIAMLQRNEKGKEARRYFIQLEKKWNSPEYVMNRALEYSRKQVEQLMLENKELKPKALFADAVEASKDSILVGQLAKLIGQNGLDIGQNRLFVWLRENGYLCSRGENYNMPTQKSIELGLMEIKERTVNNPDGSVRITKTTKITGKGQIYFVNKFCGKVA